jgi:hypothetical protein
MEAAYIRIQEDSITFAQGFYETIFSISFLILFHFFVDLFNWCTGSTKRSHKAAGRVAAAALNAGSSKSQD